MITFSKNNKAETKIHVTEKNKAVKEKVKLEKKMSDKSSVQTSSVGLVGLWHCCKMPTDGSGKLDTKFFAN